MKADCVVCGKAFEKRGNTKTCGIECRAEWSRKKNRAKNRRYRAANPEKVREADREYRAANPEKKRAKNRRYRATLFFRFLGIPPVEYAAMRLFDRLPPNPNPEQSR